MVALDKENVLAVLKRKGPLVPNELKKDVGGDTMLLGAVLSELSSRGLAKITDVKKGGSPFYYVPGQEGKIETLMEYLNPKDQETVRKLKENKVLADKTQELFVRVSLRKAKDYAKQLQVNTSQGPMLFWRYYLLPEQEAMDVLKTRYNNTGQASDTTETNPPPKAVKFVPGEEAPQQETSSSTVAQPSPQKTDTPTPQSNNQNAGSQQPVNSQPQPRPSPPKPAEQPSPKPTPVPQPKPQSTPQQKQEEKEAPKKETEVAKESQQSETKKVSEVATESQQPLSAPPRLEKTPFYVAVRDYFDNNRIKVLDELQVAKEREYEFRLRIPSAVGDLEMYCIARNKKKLTQNDVAGAVLKAKKRDLQLFYLTNGEFTKKSLQIISSEYKGVILRTF